MRDDLRRGRYKEGNNEPRSDSGYKEGEGEVERSLIRLEAAIWALMVTQQKEETPKLPVAEQNFQVILANIENSPKSGKYPSAQKTAKNLWTKRQRWEEEKGESIISLQNRPDVISSKKEQLYTGEEKDNGIKEDEQLGHLEEFNLLYSSVETSLGEFWIR